MDEWLQLSVTETCRRNLGFLRLIARNHRCLAEILMCLVLCSPAAAFAQQLSKTALVIGNSNYPVPNQLSNPTHDADLVGKALSDLGFTQTSHGPLKDLGLAQFKQAVAAFAAAAGQSDVAVFYYSGHGIQVGGTNFLVPIDASPQRGVVDVPLQMISADDILKALDQTHIRLKIIILDACRNNPFATKNYLPPSAGLAAMTQGLTAMKAPVGTVIWYATQPGETASDAGNNGGPFSNAIVHNISAPGDDIYAVFNHTGLEVMQQTSSQQQPWLAATPLDGTFYFRQAGSHDKSYFVARSVSRDRVSELFSSGIKTSTKSFVFGEDYTQVNNQLDSPFAITSWSSLPQAGEYENDEVRYLWVPLHSLPIITSAIVPASIQPGQCIAPGSYITWQFKDRKLFTISIRLEKTRDCPNYDWIFSSLFGTGTRDETIHTAQGDVSASARDEQNYAVLDIVQVGVAKDPKNIF